MSKKRQDKSITLRRHFKNRLRERYGIEATTEDIKKWVGLIQAGRGTMVMRQSIRVTVWDIMVGETKVRVVYDKNRKELITALPPNADIDWEIF